MYLHPSGVGRFDTERQDFLPQRHSGTEKKCVVVSRVLQLFAL
jgi:hypothetical protein